MRVEESDTDERGGAMMRNRMHRLLALWIALVLMVLVALALPASAEDGRGEMLRLLLSN